MGCPPVPTDVCVSHNPSHHTIPWDHGTFHRMSTCPSLRCVCVPLSISSHDPMDHGTFHGMSTCPSCRCMCVLLSIPSHDPMGPQDIPQDVHLSLSQMRVCPTVHPIPWDHGTFHGMSNCLSLRYVCRTNHPIPPRFHGTLGHSTGCPTVPLLVACASHCPSHDPMGPLDIPSMYVPLSIHDPMGPYYIPWDVHLSLSQMRVYPTVHPIPRSHGIVGHSTGCPPVPLTDARVSSCPSHPTIPWDCGTFHRMSICPFH